MTISPSAQAAGLSPIEDVIEDARNGRMFVLVDAEDRENEGDLVIPAQMATPEAINFMAKYGRGLICLSMPRTRVEQLGLQLMSSNNQTRHQTAFTVSIEAKHGVSTGISAHDRARTISVAIDPTRGPEDIATPGHVFPLLARDGGVLVRAGHTEAAVDIARLAGLYPAGVICEIMKDDGTMARLPDLIPFAREHSLKVGTIEDLIRYRRRYDNFLDCTHETVFQSVHAGDWTLRLYTNTLDDAEHIALVKGDISGTAPVLVRMHSVNVFDDVLGGMGRGSGILARSMKLIDEVGRGVVVLIRDTKVARVSELLKAREGLGKPEAGDTDGARLREYGVGAQILLDLGVGNMILLSNTPRKIVGLEGYGLHVVDHVAIPSMRLVFANGSKA
ncbi:MAG: 3,4-dihydroxy-2-butanone-4-phosphate synthase [Alphaproteobacteria bacterium]